MREFTILMVIQIDMNSFGEPNLFHPIVKNIVIERTLYILGENSLFFSLNLNRILSSGKVRLSHSLFKHTMLLLLEYIWVVYSEVPCSAQGLKSKMALEIDKVAHYAWFFWDSLIVQSSHAYYLSKEYSHKVNT